MRGQVPLPGRGQRTVVLPRPVRRARPRDTQWSPPPPEEQGWKEPDGQRLRGPRRALLARARSRNSSTSFSFSWTWTRSSLPGGHLPRGGALQGPCGASTPSGALDSRSSEPDGLTATRTAVLALALWKGPWPSPGTGGSRSRGRSCRSTSGTKTSWATCPRETHCPRHRLQGPRRPAEDPGTRPAQEGRRPAPATTAVGEALGSPPLGGTERGGAELPRTRATGSSPSPGRAPSPGLMRPTGFQGQVFHQLQRGPGGPPLPIRGRTPSSSRSFPMAPPSSTTTSPSPRTWPTTRRPSESRRQPRDLGAHEIAGGCGRVQGPMHIFPRPACPSLFPQAPRCPCRVEGRGCLGKVPVKGLREGRNPPTAALPWHPHLCTCVWAYAPAPSGFAPWEGLAESD